MIGYNEYAEAAKLLELLNRSQKMISEFNEAAGALPAKEEELKQLVEQAAELEASGKYCLDFSGRNCKKHPYELLARYPLQENEKDEAKLPDELLCGLSDGEASQVRRLYARLMKIQPMRTLFERLHDAQKTSLSLLARKKQWTKEIPKEAEYRYAQSITLDVIDNDFSILSVILQTRNSPLSQTPEVRIPKTVIAKAPKSYVLLAEALLRQKLRSSEADYHAIPGGHIALGLYADTTPENFFDNVIRNHKKGNQLLVDIRPYHGLRLVHVPQTEAWNRQDKHFSGMDEGGRQVFRSLEDYLASEKPGAEEQREEDEKRLVTNFFKNANMDEQERSTACDRICRLMQDAVSGEDAAKLKKPSSVKAISNYSKEIGLRAVRILLCWWNDQTNTAQASLNEMLDMLKDRSTDFAKYASCVQQDRLVSAGILKKDDWVFDRISVTKKTK